jgi:hypothetical protein
LPRGHSNMSSMDRLAPGTFLHLIYPRVGDVVQVPLPEWRIVLPGGATG